MRTGDRLTEPARPEKPAVTTPLELGVLHEADSQAPAGMESLLGNRGPHPRSGRDNGAPAIDLLGRVDIRTRTAAATRVQRAAGNRALARRLNCTEASLLQRDEAEPAGGDVEEPPLTPGELTLTDAGFVPMQQGGGAGQASQAGASGGAGAAKRPTPSSIRHDCVDCNEAAAFLNAGNYVGEASVQAASAAGQIRVSGSKGAFTAEVDVSWSIDVGASSMEVTDFVWPNMTDADRAAVASFRSALLAHEEGHFVASEQVTAAQTKTLKATGATQRAAVAALKTLAQQQIKDGQAALDKARDDYDNVTKHGANQAAVGGTNVHLACPRRATGASGAGATP